MPKRKPTDDELARLRQAWSRWTEARASYGLARDEVGREIRSLSEAGVPQAEIARICGVSRQAIYDLLKR